MPRPLEIFGTIDPNDENALKKKLLEVLDMVRVKVEDGQVASMAFLMVAKDPPISGDPSYTGSRFIVHPSHLDLIENVFNEMMEAYSKNYGLTPARVRAMREGK